MPIDYLSQKKKGEADLEGLLRGRNVDDEISRTMTNIKSRRSGFLDPLSGTISDLAGTGRTSIPSKAGRLNTKTQGVLAKQKFDTKRKMYDTIFQSSFNAAQQAGLDSRSATDFARKVADQKTQMEFAAGEADKGREYRLKLDSISDEFADKGISLQDQYQPSFDYGSALSRVLLGTGASLGTSYFLTKNLLNQNSNPAQSPFTSTGSRYDLPIGPEQDLGYYPRRPTGGYR